MGIVEDIKVKVHEILGQLKEKAGEATGNEALEVEGQAEQVEAHEHPTHEDAAHENQPRASDEP